MAEDQTKQEPKAAAAEKEEAPTYHRDRLIAEADAFFEQPGYVVVAALSTGRNATKVNFTTDEVEKAIKAYLEHEVEIDHPRPEVVEGEE